MTGTDVGAGETLLFDAEQGSSGAPGASGSQTTTTTITAGLDLTSFDQGSEFLLDLHQATVIGAGVTGVTFDLTDVATPIHEVFTSAASATAYFTGNVLDLGSFDAVTGDSSTLDVQMKLSVTTDDATSGFYVEAEGAGTACFCPGTLIRTARGPVAIEDLHIGDLVVTLHGPPQPIKWIGRRSYDGRFVAGQVLMLPVCIKRDAIAPCIPARDLHVSPGHALYIDGVLVPAWLLVNGTSMTQAAAVDHVTYLHLEFEAHEVIFAEDARRKASSTMPAAINSRTPPNTAHSTRMRQPRRRRFARPGWRRGSCCRRSSIGWRIGPACSRQPRRTARYVASSIRTAPLSWRVGAGHGAAGGAGMPGRAGGWQRVQRVLANHYRADLRKAGLGSGRHAFEVRLPPGAAGTVEMRRSKDGAALR